MPAAGTSAAAIARKGAGAPRPISGRPAAALDPVPTNPHDVSRIGLDPCHRRQDRFHRGLTHLKHAALKVLGMDERTLVARDAFLAYDASTGQMSGVAPTVVERSATVPNPSSLNLFLTHRKGGVPLEFEVGGQRFEARPAQEKAEFQLWLGPRAARALVDAASGDPARIADLRIGKLRGCTERVSDVTAQAMILPKNYRGPIVVCDIDDTLRDTRLKMALLGRNQAPIPEARACLWSLSEMGVPIVYVSAGTTQLHNTNKTFLAQLPPGPLLDNQRFRLFRDGVGPRAAANQGEYKCWQIRMLQSVYPQARWIGIGDDRFGDAIAYTHGRITPFILHKAKAFLNIPAQFCGKVSEWSDPDFADSILAQARADLDAAAAEEEVPGPRAAAL